LPVCAKKIAAGDEAGLAQVVKETKMFFSGTPPHMQVFMNNEDVSREIRSDAVTKNVSDYCAPMVVRSALVAQQREIGAKQSVVLRRPRYRHRRHFRRPNLNFLWWLLWTRARSGVRRI